MKFATSIATATALLLAQAAMAEPVKVGMITTLSGGGAGLGIDTRDGFDLALKLAGDDAADITVITEDDQQKPDIAVQIADKMIQQDQVDLLTGIVWSNLAMAVVPAAVQQGKFYLSTNAAPSALAGAQCNQNYFSVSYQNDNFHEAAGQAATDAGYKNVFIMAPNYPAGQDSLAGFKRFYTGDLAGEVYTQVGQTDYAGEIAQIRDLRRRCGVLLPAGRDGDFLSETICRIGCRHAADRPGLQFQPGYPAGGGRCRAGGQEHCQLVARSGQSGQCEIRRGIPKGL